MSFVIKTNIVLGVKLFWKSSFIILLICSPILDGKFYFLGRPASLLL